MPNKIIAVDFDGCLCENKYPDIGELIAETIERYKHERARGTRFILWTSRHGVLLLMALRWCADHRITFDAVNEKLPELAEKYGETRKVGADEYWDDKAVRMPQVT